MNQQDNQRKSVCIKLLELLEGFYLIREPITFKGSKFRISFIKNYTKYSPLIFAILITGFTAWAVYSDTRLIWLTVGVGILIGIVGYGCFWLGGWLVKRFFISYINDYQQVFEPESKTTNRVKTYKGLRVFWVFTGIIDSVVVSGVLYHYRGLLGLILSIIVFLPSVSIYLWVLERAMEGHTVIPTQVRYRAVIVVAAILFQIFFFWWLLEIGKGLWGGLGIAIALIIFLCMQLYFYFYSRKRQHNQQISPL